MDNVKVIIDRINNNDFSNDDLLKWLDSHNILIKCNSILAIIRLHLESDSILAKLGKIAENFDNEPIVYGIWTNAHFALAVLKMLDTKQSASIFSKAIKTATKHASEDVDTLIMRIRDGDF